jgi:hypothetical protein
LAAFARDPSLQTVRASHVEEYGKGCQAPADAIVEFQGDDPEAGPLLRYTVVKPQTRRLVERSACSGGRGLSNKRPVLQ